MNKSEILKALEWVDKSASEGDVRLLAQAKAALDTQLASTRNESGSQTAYKTACESFVRKHGREPLEDIEAESE